MRDGLYYRWGLMLDEEPTPGGLVSVRAVRAGTFHMAHKLTREAGTEVAAHRLKHHLNRCPVSEWVLVPSAAWVLVPSAAWVQQQVYLNLYPQELVSRSHV